MPSLRCELLGAPRRVEASEYEHAPGKIAYLTDGVAILCAHVTDDTWLVHRGTFDEGEFKETDPWSERDLQLERVSAFEEQPCKRVRPHLHMDQLQTIRANATSAFDALVAIATYRAEEIRSERGSPFDAQRARSRFVVDPWQWAGRTWHLPIALLCRWPKVLFLKSYRCVKHEEQVRKDKTMKD